MSSAAVEPTDELVFTKEMMRKAWLILAAMGFGALIAQMFSTVIGPALPTIKDELGLSLSAQTWTITAYSLAFGTALIAGGRMGDLVGEVKMIIIGFMIFAVGLVLAGIATDGTILIVGRAVQGIGIGISAPATLSIVVNSFPKAKRGFAVGTWGFAHGFGLLIGPIIAGYVTESIGWRWLFWIALPLTGLVIFVTLAATRGYKSVLASGRYDLIGLVLGGIAITSVTLGLQNAASGWGKADTIGPLVVGVVFGIAFAIAEVKIAQPLVDFDLWRERLFSGAFFAEAAVGFVYIPMLTFIGSLYFIGVLGMSPITAGWVIVITTGTCMVLEPGAGRWVDKIGPGIPIFVALMLQAIALFWFATFTPSTTVPAMIVPLALMGAGVGIALPACNTAGMSAVDVERAGMGSGLIQSTFNIPAALGVAVVTSIIGAASAGSVSSQVDGKAFADTAIAYTDKVQAGDTSGADSLLASLPTAIQEQVEQIAANAQSSAIAMSMVVLGVVALAGAIFALIVIGRRREPDHIKSTQAVAV